MPDSILDESIRGIYMVFMTRMVDVQIDAVLTMAAAGTAMQDKDFESVFDELERLSLERPSINCMCRSPWSEDRYSMCSGRTVRIRCM